MVFLIKVLLRRLYQDLETASKFLYTSLSSRHYLLSIVFTIPFFNIEVEFLEIAHRDILNANPDAWNILSHEKVYFLAMDCRFYEKPYCTICLIVYLIANCNIAYKVILLLAVGIIPGKYKKIWKWWISILLALIGNQLTCRLLLDQNVSGILGIVFFFLQLFTICFLGWPRFREKKI